MATRPSPPPPESPSSPPAAIAQKYYPLPEDEPEDVVFNSIYGLRTVELNRPDKHNALSGSMIRKVLSRLIEWERSDMANVVVIKGAGGRALCAGGDVAVLALQNAADPAAGWRKSAEYFDLEYKLDHYIATYLKPVVTMMDGITMGGGVGLSMHAPFRIATERTVWAMPETRIGFFPDVGASFFLPRLNGALGRYLGLTSDRVVGANAFYAGIATHYIHSATLPLLEERLAELRFRDYDDMAARLRLVDDALEEFATGLPPLPRDGDDDAGPVGLVRDRRRAIDRCFGKLTVPEIMSELERVAREGSIGPDRLPDELAYTMTQREWALETIKTLRRRSPTALHVTARLIEEGRWCGVSAAFRREFRLATRFMRHPDFTEGVTKLLLTRPPGEAVWSPPSLDLCPPPDMVTRPMFESTRREGEAKLELLCRRDYGEPYEDPEQQQQQEQQQQSGRGGRGGGGRRGSAVMIPGQVPAERQLIGVPTEAWVERFLEEAAEGKPIKSGEDALQRLIERIGERQGLRRVLSEIIERNLEFGVEERKGGHRWTGGNVHLVLDMEGLEEELGVGEGPPGQEGVGAPGQGQEPPGQGQGQ